MQSSATAACNRVQLQRAIGTRVRACVRASVLARARACVRACGESVIAPPTTEPSLHAAIAAIACCNPHHRAVRWRAHLVRERRAAVDQFDRFDRFDRFDQFDLVCEPRGGFGACPI